MDSSKTKYVHYKTENDLCIIHRNVNNMKIECFKLINMKEVCQNILFVYYKQYKLFMSFMGFLSSRLHVYCESICMCLEIDTVYFTKTKSERTDSVHYYVFSFHPEYSCLVKLRCVCTRGQLHLCWSTENDGPNFKMPISLFYCVIEMYLTIFEKKRLNCALIHTCTFCICH
jgi:hypothetical protein